MPFPIVKLPEPPKDPMPHFAKESVGWRVGVFCLDRVFRLLNLCVWLLGTGGAGYMLVHHFWP